MHKSIEACLGLVEAFRRFGFNVATETLFVVDADVTPMMVGILLRAEGKPDLPFIAGKIPDMPVEAIEAQWAAAASAWNRPETDPAGLSRVERQVIWEMHMPQQRILSLLGQLVEKGYALSAVPAEAVETIKAAMQNPVAS